MITPRVLHALREFFYFHATHNGQGWDVSFGAGWAVVSYAMAFTVGLMLPGKYRPIFRKLK